MIDKALKVISLELNQFMILHHSLNEDKVVLNALVDQDGKSTINGENKIIVSLIDISQESSIKNSIVNSRMLSKEGRELHLNLFVLISASFNRSNYEQGLKYISSVISFFNAKPVFEPSTSPALSGTGVGKLVVDMHDVDPSTKNSMWSTIGAKYVPSVIYKIRMLTITDESIRSQVDSIRAVDLDNELDE